MGVHLLVGYSLFEMELAREQAAEVYVLNAVVGGVDLDFHVLVEAVVPRELALAAALRQFDGLVVLLLCVLRSREEPVVSVRPHYSGRVRFQRLISLVDGVNGLRYLALADV